MSDITPFRIAIPDATLRRLREKLSLYDLPRHETPATDAEPLWTRGPPLDEIQRLAGYWRDGYDWRAHERRLNDTLPQFMTKISLPKFEELDVHFVHAKSKTAGDKAIPLLFAHGWPGSFLEVSKILPLLVEGEPGFDVVCPSLVDFGFSGPSIKVSYPDCFEPVGQER
jgi:pimeloyl-ACP methyl ester carboxylesterase